MKSVSEVYRSVDVGFRGISAWVKLELVVFRSTEVIERRDQRIKALHKPSGNLLDQSFDVSSVFILDPIFSAARMGAQLITGFALIFDNLSDDPRILWPDQRPDLADQCR